MASMRINSSGSSWSATRPRPASPRVRPFMLVVAQTTEHAGELLAFISGDGFFGGYYKDRVIQVDSSPRSKEESDEITPNGC